MTRGTLAIVSNDGLYISTEFNGDMYLSGNGKDAIKCLETVDDIEDFDPAIREFNESHHKYDDEEMTCKIYDSSKYLDMSKDYFDTWFSDYVFIKNISDEQIIITERKGDLVKINPKEIVVFNFGKKEDISDYI